MSLPLMSELSVEELKEKLADLRVAWKASGRYDRAIIEIRAKLIKSAIEIRESKGDQLYTEGKKLWG